MVHGKEENESDQSVSVDRRQLQKSIISKPGLNKSLKHYVEAFHEMYTGIVKDHKGSLTEEEMYGKMDELKGVMSGMLSAAGDHYDRDPKEIKAAIAKTNAKIDELATEPMDTELLQKLRENQRNTFKQEKDLQ